MKCYYHRDHDAVGLCKSCEKGLCPECAVDLGKGLACRDRCELEAKALIALVEKNIQMTGKASAMLRMGKQTYLLSAIFFIVLGGVFGAWGLLTEPRLDFPVFMGAIFMAYGVIILIRTLVMSRRSKPLSTPPGSNLMT
jgi:hypothetical protein